MGRHRGVEVVDALAELGGSAGWAELTSITSAGMVRAALRAGCVQRIGRGVYVLPELAGAGSSSDPGARAWGRAGSAYSREEGLRLARARAVARAHGVVLSHRSAAAQHDWGFFLPPRRLEVVRPPGYHRPDAAFLEVRYRAVGERERDCHVTSPLRTVVHCAADLPFGVALGIADSALRSGLVHVDDLREAAGEVVGPGAKQVRRVGACADGRAANPFESATRALALDVPGLNVEPQVTIADDEFFARVDLADAELRIVVEGDSYEFHGGPEAFARDCRRYDELVARGWLVLRFTVADVRDRPRWVADMLTAAVRQRRAR